MKSYPLSKTFLENENLNDVRAVRVERAKTRLSSFLILSSYNSWQRANHLDLLCEKLEAVERGEITRLIITLPPRHGKSMLVSQYYPAWYLGRNPNKEIIISSYGAELAYDFSRKCREIFREFGPLVWNLNLSPDLQARNQWGIENHTGGLKAAGVGGPLTGRGGELILIDDPVKNWEEASSKTVRDTTYEWYRSTLRTRLAPGGRIILIQTRWHQDDLAGRLIADMQAGTGEQWEVLNLPAIAGENDPLGRLPGTPLWPERFPLTELDKTRLSMGSYIWNALYQQSPGNPEGSLFKRQFFHYFTVKDDNFIINLPNDKTDIIPIKSCVCFQTCDPAGSAKSSADYFVLSTWYLTPKGQLLLRDVIREQLEGPDQPDLFRQAYQRWAPAVQGVEVAGLGLTLFQYLQRSGLPVVELKPDRDKVTRALPAAARYQSGSVYHYKPAPWLDAIEEELIGFPHAAHDDFVDTLSYAVRLMVPMVPLLQSPTVPVTYEEPYEISPV